MAIGPVQLIVLGFRNPDFHGEIIAELEGSARATRSASSTRWWSTRTPTGSWKWSISATSQQEAIELGSKIGALIGLGIEGEEGAEAGAIAGAEEVDAAGGVHVFTEEEAWDVLDDIPNDSAAALVLIEHHWAVPLRDAIFRAGGFRISDGFISPLDLVGIGLMEADEAKALHDMETSAAASTQ